MSKPWMIDPIDLERFLEQAWESNDDGLTGDEEAAATHAFADLASRHALYELWLAGRIRFAWRNHAIDAPGSLVPVPVEETAL